MRRVFSSGRGSNGYPSTPHLAVTPRANLLSLLVVGAVVFSSSDGYACGATETVLEGVLPRPGETSVPIDSVLWATGNHHEMEIRLRRVVAQGSLPGVDAGAAVALEDEAAEVFVRTTCRAEHNLRVCMGSAELEANTEYDWQVVATNGGGEEGPWQSFTTGDDDGESVAPEIDVTVVRNDVLEFYGCGGEAHLVELEFSATDLTEPIVLASTMSRDYPYAWAGLLNPDSPSERFSYLPSADCEDLVAYDRLGTEYPLGRVCFDEELPRTYEFTDGTRVPLSELADADTPDHEPDSQIDTGEGADEPDSEDDAGEALNEPEAIGTNPLTSEEVASCALAPARPPSSALFGWAALLLFALLERRSYTFALLGSAFRVERPRKP